MARWQTDQRADDRIYIKRVWLLQEFEPALKVDVLLGDGGDLFGRLRTRYIPSSFLVFQES